jgi:microcystin-dependent protein
MTTLVEPGMVKDGFATTADLSALRSMFVGTYHDLAYEPNAEAEPWFIPCYGQTVLIASYPALFAKLGTTYGGNGTTTFGIPDHRGRTRAGKDNMGGASANRLTGFSGGLNGDVLGATGGAEKHALIVAQLPSHAHGGETQGAGAHHHTHRMVGDGSREAGPVGSGDYANNETTGTTSDVPDHTHGIPAEGGNEAHNNVQPTIIVVVCILAY